MENKIKSAYIWNNQFTNLPMWKICSCQSPMRLEAKEDTKGQVSYYYLCTFVAKYSSCGNMEEVK
jgi:hypothetical protein